MAPPPTCMSQNQALVRYGQVKSSPPAYKARSHSTNTPTHNKPAHTPAAHRRHTAAASVATARHNKGNNNSTSRPLLATRPVVPPWSYPACQPSCQPPASVNPRQTPTAVKAASSTPSHPHPQAQRLSGGAWAVTGPPAYTSHAQRACPAATTVHNSRSNSEHHQAPVQGMKSATGNSAGTHHNQLCGRQHTNTNTPHRAANRAAGATGWCTAPHSATPLQTVAHRPKGQARAPRGRVTPAFPRKQGGPKRPVGWRWRHTRPTGTPPPNPPPRPVAAAPGRPTGPAVC